MNENINIPNNSEIDEALKEFETKSQTQQLQKAPKTVEITKHDTEGVKFEVPSYGTEKFSHPIGTSKMVNMIIKYSGGMIKEQKQAEWVLFGFVIVAISISLFLFFGKILNSGARALTNSQIEQIIKNQQGVQTH
jgi:hypothetical protein